MFPGLVIWNEMMHAKKTWNTNSLLHLWLPRSCWQTTHVWKRTEDAVGMYCGSKDGHFIRHRESCHAFATSHLWVLKRPSRAKQLASCAVKPYVWKCSVLKPCLQNVLTIMIIHWSCVFIFMVYINHNIFTTKMSISMVLSVQFQFCSIPSQVLYLPSSELKDLYVDNSYAS